jgi:hypothetical protein
VFCVDRSDILREAHAPLRNAWHVLEELRATLRLGSEAVRITAPLQQGSRSTVTSRPLPSNTALTTPAFTVTEDYQSTAVRFRDATDVVATSIESARRLIEDYLAQI